MAKEQIWLEGTKETVSSVLICYTNVMMYALKAHVGLSFHSTLGLFKSV